MTSVALLALLATGLVALGVVRLRGDGARAVPQPRRLSRSAGLFALLAVAAVVVLVPVANGWLLLVLVRPAARRLTRAGIRALARP
jgi:hypothetical protein